MPRTREEFSEKEKLFIDFYVTHGSPTFFNATQSAIKAGYSEDSARTYGYELLKKQYIIKEINKRVKKLKDQHMEKEEIIYRISSMARSDFSLFDDITSLADLKGHPFSFLVKKVKLNKEGGIEEIELHDPQSALRDLAKIHKMLDDWQARLNIDYSRLTDEQVKRLANGEELLDILLPKSK